MTRPSGIHHLAISTADIKAQIEYFTDVLGMELVALYWMHGVDGAWHGFLRLHDHSYVAFVQMEEIGRIDGQLGVTHAGHAGGPCAAGTMQHVAFDVDSVDELHAMRDRIRSRGIQVLGPIDHGMCASIYFAGPEGLTLEISTSTEAIDADHWIDPEVVRLAGISDDDLQRYRRPPVFAPASGPVPQPPSDDGVPRLSPVRQYERLMAMSDDDVATRLSTTEPPVR